MKKIYGIAALLLAIMIAATFLTRGSECGLFDLPEVVRTSTFLSSYNLENLLQRLGLFGVLSLAAAFVIVTGGIDLSIGSVVCVAGCVLPWLLRDLGLPPLLAMVLVLSLSAAIGLWHGLLVVASVQVLDQSGPVIAAVGRNSRAKHRFVDRYRVRDRIAPQAAPRRGEADIPDFDERFRAESRRLGDLEPVQFERGPAQQTDGNRFDCRRQAGRLGHPAGDCLAHKGRAADDP